jgi:membrane protein YdbS with pleckstrin-like domain
MMIHPEHTEVHTAAEQPLRGLDRRVLWYWRLSLVAQTVALWIAVLLLDRWQDWLTGTPLLSLLIPVIGVGSAIVWPPLQYRSWGFRLREGDLYVRRGVLSRVTSVIPHRRIQHVDTRRDLLERWLGLARLVVYTAGIRGAEITIPGIAAEEAEALRDYLAVRGGKDEGV